MQTSSIIETGVDRLVSLVNGRGKISFNDAAKILNVSPAVIAEWAEFLEEEGIINVEYKLTTRYLVERKLTKKELDTKSKEFVNKKELFVRKAEISISLLQQQSEYLKEVKKEFDSLSKKFSIEIDSVKGELNEINKYEEARHRLREELRDQKAESEKKFLELSGKLTEEQKKLQAILEGIESEERELEHEKAEAKSMEEIEKEVHEKIADIRSKISEVERRSKDVDDPLNYSIEKTERLSSRLDKIKKDIAGQKEDINEILRKSSEHKGNIEALQKRVFYTLKENEGKLKNARELGERIRGIFEKRKNATEMIDKMDKNRKELQNELEALIKKAKAFQLSAKSRDAEKHILNLEKQFEKVNNKINVFEDMYKKIISQKR